MANQPTRRGFLAAGLSGLGGACASMLNAQADEPTRSGGPAMNIVSVTAHAVKLLSLDARQQVPTFESDFDPRRWRYRGPFAQLNSAIVVTIKTDQGVTGYGLGGGGGVACQIIDGHLRHLLLGANALNVELLWDQMYTSANAYGRRGVFVMALSGVDNALWDIVGKSMDRPVYRLLGGTTKEKVPVYLTASRVEAGLELGIDHFKLPIRDGLAEGRPGMERTVQTLTRARAAVGPDKTLMIDCGSRWDDVTYTVEMARRLEAARLYFIEEPLSPDNILGYAELVHRIGSTLIVSGEHEYTQHGFQMLLHHKAAQILQPDVSWSGGVTALRKIAAMAAEHSLPIIPHRGGSLYGMSIVLSSPNCPLAESFGTSQPATDLMEAMTPRFADGFYYPNDKPGFGTAITDEMVRRHRQ